MICRRKRPALVGALAFGLLAGCSGEGGGLEDRMVIAEVALGEGRAGDAVRALERYEQGGDPATRLLLAEALLAQGETARAERLLSGDGFPPSLAARAEHLRGRAALARGDLARAGQAFDRALALEPADADLWTDIARLRYRGGEQLAAPDAIQRALAIDPANLPARHLQALIRRDAAGLNVAAGEFEALLRDHSRSDIARDAAAVYLDAGRVSDALELLDPDTEEDSFLRAVAAARTGDWNEARMLLGTVPQAQVEQPAALLLSATVDLASGLDDAAAKTLDELARKQPDNRVVAHLLALALYRSSAHRELVSRLGDRAAAADGSPYLRTMVGRAYEALDRREEAAPYLDTAARARPNTLTVFGDADTGVASGGGDSVALRSSLRRQIGQGDTASALSEARAFVDANPASADGARLLGDVYLAVGEWREALFQYERAGQVRGDWPLVQRLVLAHRRLDQPSEAEAIMQRYIAGGGRERAALSTYAAMLARRGNLGAASRLVEYALAKGGRNDPGFLSRWSGILREAGDGEAALQYAGAAYRLSPMHPAALAALRDATADPDVRARMEDKLARLSSR